MYLVICKTPSRRGTMILFMKDLNKARRQAMSLMMLIAKIEAIRYDDLMYRTPVSDWRDVLSALQASDPRIEVDVCQTALNPMQLGAPVLEEPKRFARWSSNKNVALGRALGIPVRW